MSNAMPQPERAPRRRRWRLYVLLASLVLLVVYVGLDLWAGHRVTVATARLEQQIGPLSVRRLGATPVPAAENRARLVRAAAALAVPPSQDALAFISRAGSARETTPIPEVALAYVAANQAAIHLAAGFGSRRQSDWGVDYASGGNMPSLLEIRMLGNVLYLSSLIDLEQGHADDAARQIGLGLAVSASLRQEPHLISQLIRIAIASREIDVVQRLVTQASPSPAALAELARWLEENREPDPMTVGLVGETILIDQRFLRDERGQIDPSAVGGMPWTAVLGRLGRPFLRFAHASYLQTMADLMGVQSGQRPRTPFAPEHGSFITRPFVGPFTAGLQRAVITGDDYNSGLAAAAIAVALRRYKLDRVEYPADLSALVPAYLPALPIDPYSGRPPAYVRAAAGFSLRVIRREGLPPTVRPLADWVVNR